MPLGTAVENKCAAVGYDAPARNAVAGDAVFSDTTDLTTISRGLYVGTAGDVKVNMADTGTAITFKSVPAGTLLPICVSRIYSTGTGASNVTILY